MHLVDRGGDASPDRTTCRFLTPRLREIQHDHDLDAIDRLACAGPLRCPPSELCPASAAQERPGSKAEGYVWNEAGGRKDRSSRAHRRQVENGEEIFEICSACHLPSGAGRPDGTFPQLAGQHATVLIKQIADIRGGPSRQPDHVPLRQVTMDRCRRSSLTSAAYHRDASDPAATTVAGSGKNLELGKKLYACQLRRVPRRKYGEGDTKRSSTRSSRASTTSTCCDRSPTFATADGATRTRTW